ncbi:hypothetical protein [Asticcacaulis sp. AC402]|uniref:hypothetical protein n=1 Tax=Asticcacaulis sp. AC402 TaxID=1282361 RepID=UPI0009E4ABAF
MEVSDEQRPARREQAWSDLKAFLTQRTEQGVEGDVAARSFDQIVAEQLGQNSVSGGR